MAANNNLHTAKAQKNDVFFTQLTDVENELKHYKSHFKDKVVFCNCDDPFSSAFWTYFHLNFAELGLKKLISTHYDPENPTYKMEYEGGDDNDVNVGICTPLEGNGDFRNVECVELLKECDIVCTNPPFSLFKDYLSFLVGHDKKFLIIGNQNALHYRDVFPLVQNNMVWLGYNHVKEFIKPDGSTQKFGNVIWFTNLDIQKRHDDIDLYKKYIPEDYPKYDNFDAINVDAVNEIPSDYFGYMGVPDGFIEKYNPERFEIIGRSGDTGWVFNECEFFTPPDPEKISAYKKENKGWRLQNVYLLNDGGHPVLVYSRIFVKRKENNQ